MDDDSSLYNMQTTNVGKYSHSRFHPFRFPMIDAFGGVMAGVERSIRHLDFVV